MTLLVILLQAAIKQTINKPFQLKFGTAVVTFSNGIGYA
jgi:hypothetical protein